MNAAPAGQPAAQTCFAPYHFRCRIFGLPFDPQAAWTVDACLLPTSTSSAPAAASGAAGAGGSSPSGLLFLDIVQQEDWSGDPADRERFMKWGYR